MATSSGKRVDENLKNADLTNILMIQFGDEVTHGKPHPEIFLTAYQKLGVAPEDALVLEDSEAGILAAYDGHIDVICVPDMKYPEPQFVEKVTKLLIH